MYEHQQARYMLCRFALCTRRESDREHRGREGEGGRADGREGGREREEGGRQREVGNVSVCWKY
jgi:hypothetical protein